MFHYKLECEASGWFMVMHITPSPLTFLAASYFLLLHEGEGKARKLGKSITRILSFSMRDYFLKYFLFPRLLTDSILQIHFSLLRA